MQKENYFFFWLFIRFFVILCRKSITDNGSEENFEVPAAGDGQQ